MNEFTEDRLVQKTFSDYLHSALGWQTIHAFHESPGISGTLGRRSEREVILTRHLRPALESLNPDLPEAAYTEAVRRLTEQNVGQSLVLANREKHNLLRDGVKVAVRGADGKTAKRTLRVFDFENPENNHFLAVREFWIQGDLYRRRADILGFVNGIPLLFIELKNTHRDLETAYNGNLADYKDVIPHLFHHNAVILLSNGEEAKVGTITAKFNHFHEWKRLAEDEPGVVDAETLLKGVCSKQNFLELFEHFLVFDDSGIETAKILAQNQQYLGVNQAFEAVRERKKREGRLGVFWHTQGSGKSYSMVFLTRKVHRVLGQGFTFLVCTDRDDLDNQIYQSFAGCGLVDNDQRTCRPRSGAELRKLLGERLPYVFTLIQKFNQDVDPAAPYTTRDDVIVLVDEAHRTQYGRLALNRENALPGASYMAFTGTPLFSDDEITRRVFGEYVSTYDFQRAVDDGATLPLFYSARGEKLGVATHELNERIAEKLDELEHSGALDDLDVTENLERELRRDYHVLTSDRRLEQIAEDFVDDYSATWECGKAMLICLDKITCVKMHGLIEHFWEERIESLERSLGNAKDAQEEVEWQRRITWMRETRAAVVISEEQGEVEKFRKWGLDITPHRRLIKNGFEITAASERWGERRSVDVETAFKDERHPFRIAIVCAMWLTGFDVPSLANLYLDKPLKAHTLMQAIARANRVNEGKNNGLIIDYCGILRNLRKALATFAGVADGGREGGHNPLDPTRPEEDLLGELAEAIDMVRSFLGERGASLDAVLDSGGFARIAAVSAAKEAINTNDETRKRFGVLGRTVFKKFKACLRVEGINAHRLEYDAINHLYRSLEKDRQTADISDIVRELHAVVDAAIDLARAGEVREEPVIYDISKIDFDRLRKEFRRAKEPNTTAQNLREIVERRLADLMARNPLRTNFQQRYEEIVAAYNREKDRPVIQATFDALLDLYEGLDDEAERHLREGLDEESLAVFDLLKKSELAPSDVRRIKNIAAELLETLKAEKLRIDLWREKSATRAAVQTAIRDFLWSDETGLPGSYSENEVEARADAVFLHIQRAYPQLPSPIYAAP